VLDTKPDGKQPAMSAQSPNTAPWKVILTSEACETERRGVSGKRGEWITRVEVIEPRSTGLCECSHVRDAA